MGWRDFQASAPMEFMENMDLITPEPSLIPLIPLIPVEEVAVKAEFDPAHWQEEIKRLADEFSSRDPGGDCWEYVKKYHPKAWRDFVAAEQHIDIAYGEQNAEKIGVAISQTLAKNSTLIELWDGRSVTNPMGC